MPIYSYDCRGCGKTTEYLLRMGQNPDACSSCGAEGSMLERTFANQIVSAVTGEVRGAVPYSDRAVKVQGRIQVQMTPEGPVVRDVQIEKPSIVRAPGLNGSIGAIRVSKE